MVAIIEKNYSASVSGLLLFGNDQFTSVKSYEGLFMSMHGSVNHVKSAVQYLAIVSLLLSVEPVLRHQVGAFL